MNYLEQEASTLTLPVRKAMSKAIDGSHYAETIDGDPLGDFLTLLSYVRKEIDSIEGHVKKVQTHTCSYNDDDYCSLCGRDGRT